MAQLFANNAYSSLGASLSAVATSLTLATGTGSRFPSPTGGNHFLLTLAGLDSNGNENAWEIVRVTARSTDTLTIVRAQEGTTAALWASGTRVELRATKGTFDGLLQLAGGTITGPVSVMNGAYTALKVGVTGLVSVGGEAGSAEAKFTITDGGNAGLEFSPTAIAGANRILSYNRATMAFASMTLMASDIKLNIGGTDRVTVDGSGNATFTGAVQLDGSVLLKGTTTQQGASEAGYWFNHTGGGTNRKLANFQYINGTFVLRYINDGYAGVAVTPLVIDSSGNATFSGSLSLPSGSINFANNLFSTWKNAAGGLTGGTAGAFVGKASDNNFYFQNFEGDTVFQRASYAATLTLSAAGNATFSGNVAVGGGTLGYGAGSGGTVTQATSKSTAVTLNKPSGQITMHNAALAAGGTVGFVLNNSVLGANDTMGVNSIYDASYDATNYSVEVRQLGAGGVYVYVTNKSAGSLSNALKLQFNVIKGSTI